MPTPKTLTCLSCLASSQPFVDSHDQRAIKKATGYESIICDDTTFKWLCPECLDKIIPVVNKLHELLRNDNNIYWNGLRYLLKHKLSHDKPSTDDRNSQEYQAWIRLVCAEQSLDDVLGEIAQSSGVLRSLHPKPKDPP